MDNLKERIEAERRVWPWPQFGYSSDPRMAARDGFNMALDIVLDILDTSEPVDQTCSICYNVIVNEARGGPHPSPGDHDTGPHVRKNYGL